MNRLAILEDNLEFSRSLLNYIIGQNKKIQLFSLAINGEEILEQVNLLQENDILLLDLGLPKINGLEVIDRLKEKGEHIPHIIVMSGNSNLLEKLKKYAPYIYTAIEKPFAFTRIVDIIEQITYESEQKSYEKLIKEELRKFELNVTTLGYVYIIDAISFALEDKTLLKDMQNRLYKNISVKHNDISVSNIKWSIEKCIKSMKRYTASNVLKTYFHVEAREKITPKLFITILVENLKPKIQKEENQEKEEAYY